MAITRYGIQSGDTLSGIAAKKNTTVSELLKLNPQITDPDKIYAGKFLNVPIEVPTGVVRSTTLEGITGVDEKQLAAPTPDIGITEESVETPLMVDSQQARRKKIEEEIKATLAGGLAKPALPSYEADFEALRSEQGITALETQLNTIDKEMTDLDASLRQGLYDIEGKLMPMELIGTRQRELKRQAQEQMDELTRRKQVLTNQYNTKIGLINSLMKLKEMDYNTANAAYNTAFNQIIQIQNLIEGRLSKEAQIANQERDDARANINVMLKFAADTGTSWNDLDFKTQTQMTQLELQGGLPTGIIEAYMTSRPGMSVDYVTTGYDAAGNQITSFFSYNNGNPTLIKALASGAVKVKDGEKSAAVTMKSDLMALRGTDGYVSPADYKEGKALWFDREGLDKEDYDKLFSLFVDPRHPQDYALEKETLTITDSIQQLKDKMNYSRKEAEEYIIAFLEKKFGEGAIPKAIKDSIEDALVETYGRTFWQKVLPGGR